MAVRLRVVHQRTRRRRRAAAAAAAARARVVRVRLRVLRVRAAGLAPERRVLALQRLVLDRQSFHLALEVGGGGGGELGLVRRPALALPLRQQLELALEQQVLLDELVLGHGLQPLGLHALVLVYEVFDEKLLLVVGRRVELALGLHAEAGVARSAGRRRREPVGVLEILVELLDVAVVLEEELVAVVGGFGFYHFRRLAPVLRVGIPGK